MIINKLIYYKQNFDKLKDEEIKHIKKLIKFINTIKNDKK